MNTSNQLTILITGGAGFLGSHLTQRLLGEGHKVICVDSLITGNRHNLTAFGENPNFRFIEHDVVNPLKLSEKTEKIDQVYNLACPASPPHYQANPLHTLKTNVLGVMNLLELAHQHNARFFQASTSEVYGDPKMHPQTEEYWGNVNPVGIRSCYDEGKRCAETMIFDFHRQYGLEIKVARIFNTYGPQMDPKDGRVVSNFIIQALKGEDITMYGDGSQTRSFCYVTDLIEGFLRLMNSPAHVLGPINLGNPVEFTVKALAQKVLQLTGAGSQLRFDPLPQDDPSKRKPDITLAMDKLGWQPIVQLEEGLLSTIEYFKNTPAN